MEARGSVGFGAGMSSMSWLCSACSSSSSSKHPYHRHCGCAIHVLANGFKGGSCDGGSQQLKVPQPTAHSYSRARLCLPSSGDRGMSKLTAWASD